MANRNRKATATVQTAATSVNASDAAILNRTGKHGVTVADFFASAIPHLAAKRNATLVGMTPAKPGKPSVDRATFRSKGIATGEGLAAAFVAEYGMDLSTVVGTRPSKARNAQPGATVKVYDGPLYAAERAGLVVVGKPTNAGPRVFLPADAAEWQAGPKHDGNALADEIFARR
jgi:hypothetical protein